jgi:sarcosine oxidase subunit gamma
MLECRAQLKVTRIAERGLLLLQSAVPLSFRDAIANEIGLEVPEPQRASLARDYALLWMSPAEWLLELPAAEVDSMEIALSRRLASALAAITDVSDALASFDLKDEWAADVLMSGCSLDLDPETFPTGQVARTAVADFPTIVWRPHHSDGFRCLVDSSLAEPFRDWLMGSRTR